MNKHVTEKSDESVEYYSPSTSVVVDEVLTDQFGTFAWPSATILQDVLDNYHDLLKNKTVLELGCGVGIGGIFASKFAKWVYLTDMEYPPSILENCKRNCEKNNCKNTTLPFRWARFDENILSLPKIDVLIGSDICYDTHLLDDLFCTISFFVHRNPDLQIFFVNPERLSISTVQRLELLWDIHFSYFWLDGSYYLMRLGYYVY